MLLMNILITFHWKVIFFFFFFESFYSLYMMMKGKKITEFLNIHYHFCKTILYLNRIIMQIYFPVIYFQSHNREIFFKIFSFYKSKYCFYYFYCFYRFFEIFFSLSFILGWGNNFLCEYAIESSFEE